MLQFWYNFNKGVYCSKAMNCLVQAYKSLDYKENMAKLYLKVESEKMSRCTQNLWTMYI